VAWLDNKGTPLGSYIGEINGAICGATPEKTTSGYSSPKPLTSTPAATFPLYLRQYSPSGRK
jgi:hypothetical protein